MTVRRSSWSGWVDCLRRRHLAELVAWLLEAAGPLKLLGAQTLYFGGIFLRPWLSPGTWEALTALLENEMESRDFVIHLRGEEVDS